MSRYTKNQFTRYGFVDLPNAYTAFNETRYSLYLRTKKIYPEMEKFFCSDGVVRTQFWSSETWYVIDSLIETLLQAYEPVNLE